LIINVAEVDNSMKACFLSYM